MVLSPLRWLPMMASSMLALGERYFDEVVSCATWPMPEVDYLSVLSLNKQNSERYQVEMADFDGRQEIFCIKGANWFQVEQ